MNRQELLVLVAKHLRITPAEVDVIVRSAPYRYRRYTVQKRDGGHREIFHPAPALKAIQRWVGGKFLANLPVHESVYSYVKNRSIGMNAAAHLRSNYFVRYDFRDFFPSITGAVVARFLRQSVKRGYISLDKTAVMALVRVMCRSVNRTKSLVLSIGAPSSPSMSNSLLFDFDARVFELAKRFGVIYTRYADDIYVSAAGKEQLVRFDGEFRRIVSAELPFLGINEDKVQWLSRKRRVTITGVNIATSRTVSVGRTLKRSIRTRLHLALLGELERSELPRLRGQIAYVMGVEKDYLHRLSAKFGTEAVKSFMGSLE